MNGAVVVCLAWFAVVVGAGAALTARAPVLDPPARATRARQRTAVVVSAAVGQWGAAITALIVYLAGAAALVVVLWPLGELAHALEQLVDRPAFGWFQARQVDGWWSTLWQHLTNIGKPRIAQGVDLVAAIGFALVWWRRGWSWWVPPALLFSGYVLEKHLQIVLQDVVHRGHPPTTLGTFPSGGCARVLIVYGLVLYLFTVATGTRERRAWFATWSVLAVLATVQAYARTYNLEHWLTDVVGGLVFGVLGLLLMTSVARVLGPGARVSPRETVVQERQPG
ncbi:phosphatase PAP2 family protein [Nocardioides mangrovicus]|uniref:Phosphatase PAP2 family protein n=1 Tax=Nocardioides mangrovicus TaxID=2478913 RepID=A0A3L8NXP2_9ACTN|nr:phosphatase PAP2 family protein [Nocardioides mangrovicus]RLV47611.1 phosphatase PAP2 family protein [Nocardioides mangrovicus]